MKFAEWITKKYVSWRGEEIEDHSINDFAIYIGGTQETLSHWMKGSTPKRHETIVKLVRMFGPEVYDILELERPPEYAYDPIYDELHKLFYEMTPEQRARYLDIGRNIRNEN